MKFYYFFNKGNLLIWLIIFQVAFSCIPKRKLVYLNNNKFNTKTITDFSNKPKVYILQSRDLISIKVRTLDSESSSYFNLQPDNTLFNFNTGLSYVSSYSIDSDGNIKLPEVGFVKVGGLSVPEAQKLIEEKLKKYLDKSAITVKLVSFKITVLGEVKNPGQFYVYNDQSTILEALGMAGDLTDYGNRENITLVRQSDSGVGAIIINLKDPSLLSSDYFFLQPNDVLYVQPLKAKTARANLNNLSYFSIVFGVLSTSWFILNLLKK